MIIEPGYIGWPNGLSLAWGRRAMLKGRSRFVSIAWRDYIVMLSWGNINAAP